MYLSNFNSEVWYISLAKENMKVIIKSVTFVVVNFDERDKEIGREKGAAAPMAFMVTNFQSE